MAGYVLIVEKDAELQQRIGAALRDAGYELAAETEASWARRSIAVRRPDAVVLGTRLSDGDGFGLAEELRRDPETRGVPIVFIASSHRGTSHRAEARRRFAPAEYLPTPLDARAIPRVSPSCLRRSRPPCAGDDETPPPAVQVHEGEPPRSRAADASGATSSGPPRPWSRIRPGGVRRDAQADAAGAGAPAALRHARHAARCCCSATPSKRSSSSRTAIRFRSARMSSASAWGRSCWRRSSSPARRCPPPSRACRRRSASRDRS